MPLAAVTKKCPECLTYMPASAKQCPACGIKVGSVDRSGMARRPVDWKGYGTLFISLIVLVVYLWWAFG